MSEEKRFYRAALESQLDHLKGRLEGPDASYWGHMGQWAQDFDLWLERARPWISCASRLIALRVEQILKGFKPDDRSEPDRKKFVDLVEEAEKQLKRPGSSIQVIDLSGAGGAEKTVETPVHEAVCPFISDTNTMLPAGLVEVPEYLQPGGNVPVQFRYIIPN